MGMKEKKERCLTYFPKKWDPVFSTNRRHKKEGHNGELIKEGANAGDDLFSIFLLDFQQGAPSCKIEEMASFIQGATLENLKSAVEPAGSRRSAWIYDRSSALLSDEEDGQNNGVTTATGLYRRLVHPQFHTQSNSNPKIRLIHIQNLDPYSIVALGSTVSFEVSILRDAIWKHLALQTSIRIKIPLKLSFFQMEIHMPYYSLRTRPGTGEHSSDPINGCFQRQWIDLPFLNIPPPQGQEEVTYGLQESHMTFLICGSDEKRWVGYSFVDAHPNEEELKDLVSPGKGMLIDPISESPLDMGEILLTDPREYFLRILQMRLDHVFQEWELIIRKFERCSQIHQPRNLCTLSKDSLYKTFDWNQQAIHVLGRLLEVLSQTITAWHIFSSPNGDISYFSDIFNIDTSLDQPCSSILVSLQAIQETIETLEGLKFTLECLAKSCHESAEALQLRLTLEANEAVRNNGLFTNFTISIISPFMVVIGYYSIPQNSAPFKLDVKYFSLAIILIMLIVQLLFAVFSTRPWWYKKYNSWVRYLRLYLESYQGVLSRSRKRDDKDVESAMGGPRSSYFTADYQQFEKRLDSIERDQVTPCTPPHNQDDILSFGNLQGVTLPNESTSSRLTPNLDAHLHLESSYDSHSARIFEPEVGFGSRRQEKQASSEDISPSISLSDESGIALDDSSQFTELHAHGIFESVTETHRENFRESLANLAAKDQVLADLLLKRLGAEVDLILPLFDGRGLDALLLRDHGSNQEHVRDSRPVQSMDLTVSDARGFTSNETTQGAIKRLREQERDGNRKDRNSKRNKVPRSSSPTPPSKKATRPRFKCPFCAKCCITHCQKNGRLSTSQGYTTIHHILDHFKEYHTVVRCHRCYTIFEGSNSVTNKNNCR